MDLATFAEQDMADADASATALPPKGPSLMDEDHVTWQASQRREVLSRFIDSTKKQFQRDSSPAESHGWPLGPFSTASSPQSDSGNCAASIYTRRPLSKARTSEGNIEPRLDPAKSTTSDRHSSIPFFDKKDPARFLALLKGVSARVDENAGMRNHDIAGPSGHTDDITKLKRKRTQMSVGRSQAAKRSRPSSPGSGKIGENAMSNEFEPTFSKAQNIRGFKSLPDVTSEDRFAQVTKELQDAPVLSPRISPTFSKHPPPCPSASQKPEFETRSGHLKLHPLLQKGPSGSSSMTHARGSCSHIVPTQGFSNSNPITDVPHSGKTLSPESVTSSRTSTPGAASKFSVRPPLLGMRRTRTMPSQPYGLQTRTTPDLPTKQKGFKPPLLSNRSQQLEMTSKAKPHASCPTNDA